MEDEGNEDERRRLEVAARDEFFRSIVTEVHEEVNVAPLLQQPPTLLGVVLQTDACTPSFCRFQVLADSLHVVIWRD